MNKKLLAEGAHWELIEEGDRSYLRLYNEFGIVEIQANNLDYLNLFGKIEREYNKLKEEGPIEVLY